MLIPGSYSLRKREFARVTVSRRDGPGDSLSVLPAGGTLEYAGADVEPDGR